MAVDPSLQEFFLSAIAGNDTDGVRNMLENVQINVELRSPDTHPLYVAALNGHKDIVSMLIEFGAADVNAELNACDGPEFGRTPLMAAALNNQVEVMQVLVEFEELEINQENKDSDECPTALHLAAKEGHHDAVQLLLLYGADRTLRNTMPGNQKTAEDLARNYGMTEVAALIRNYGERPRPPIPPRPRRSGSSPSTPGAVPPRGAAAMFGTGPGDNPPAQKQTPNAKPAPAAPTPAGKGAPAANPTPQPSPPHPHVTPTRLVPIHEGNAPPQRPISPARPVSPAAPGPAPAPAPAGTLTPGAPQPGRGTSPTPAQRPVSPAPAPTPAQQQAPAKKPAAVPPTITTPDAAAAKKAPATPPPAKPAPVSPAPAAKEAPPAKPSPAPVAKPAPAPVAKDAPVAKNTPAAKEAPATTGTPAAQGTPASKAPAKPAPTTTAATPSNTATPAAAPGKASPGTTAASKPPAKPAPSHETAVGVARMVQDNSQDLGAVCSVLLTQVRAIKAKAPPECPRSNENIDSWERDLLRIIGSGARRVASGIANCFSTLGSVCALVGSMYTAYQGVKIANAMCSDLIDFAAL